MQHFEPHYRIKYFEQWLRESIGKHYSVNINEKLFIRSLHWTAMYNINGKARINNEYQRIIAAKRGLLFCIRIGFSQFG